METTELGNIDLKGPLPKPYMFDVATENVLRAFAPSEYPGQKNEIKRLYHVGLNRHMGRLRYQYYKRRGWIKAGYYIRPKQSAWLEWAYCLASPRYARGSWLRLSPQAEAKALHAIKWAVIALFAAVIFATGMVVGEIRILHLVQQQQPVQTDLRVNA